MRLFLFIHQDIESILISIWGFLLPSWLV